MRFTYIWGTQICFTVGEINLDLLSDRTNLTSRFTLYKPEAKTQDQTNGTHIDIPTLIVNV